MDERQGKVGRHPGDSLIEHWNQELFRRVPETYRPPIYLALGVLYVGACFGITVLVGKLFIHVPADRRSAPLGGAFWIAVFALVFLILLPVLVAIAFGGTGSRATSGKNRATSMKASFGSAVLLFLGSGVLLAFGYVGAMAGVIVGLIYVSIGVAWFRTPTSPQLHGFERSGQ